MVLKVISYGFIFKRNSYLRDNWGIFEFTNVILSWIQFIPGCQNASYIQLVRVLRPLECLSRHPSMRRVAENILKCLRCITAIAVLITFIVLVFAILGIAIFAGTFHGRCFNNTVISLNETQNVMSGDLCNFGMELSVGASCAVGFVCSPAPRGFSCPGTPSDWASGADTCEYNPNPDRFHFDEIWPAFISVFRVFVGDKWSESMRNAHAGAGAAGALLYFSTLIAFFQWVAGPLIIAACWNELLKGAALQARRHHVQFDGAGNSWTPISSPFAAAILEATSRLFSLAWNTLRLPAVRITQAVCPTWLAELIGDELARARNLRLARRRAAQIIEHWSFERAVLGLVAVNTLTLCLTYFSSSEYEDNLW